jgi:hypothetical protein
MKNFKLAENDIDDILDKLDDGITNELERLDHVMLLLDAHDDLVDAYVSGEMIGWETDDDIEDLFNKLDKYIGAE